MPNSTPKNIYSINRKLNSSGSTMATLTVEVAFKKAGEEILIKAGSLIRVDTANNIALFGDHHFDIFPEEYQLHHN